jgi:exosortase/archaeosortase family protein
MVVAASYMVFLTVDQMHWWRLKADYGFGWLVPVFVTYLIYDRWPKIRECLAPAGPSPIARGWQAVFSLLASLGLGGGLLLFLLGAVYRAGSGVSQPGSLALAAGFAGILLGIVFFNVPPGGVAAGSRRERGPAWANDVRVRATALFLFPALIWLISAPLVSAIENAVSLILLRKVVAVVFAVFGFLGYPLIQEGNVLILPHGQVGVADACSGIRSLTGCLFAGSFLAAVFLDRLWKKFLLVVAALGLAFLTNLLRSLFLTAWAYAYGSEAIEGALHDATGYAVLVVTCIGLFGLLPLFNAANWRRWFGVAPPPAAGATPLGGIDPAGNT